MKKLFVLFAALLAALFVVGCASKPPAGPTAAELMAEAKSGAPNGTLVGQATARGTKDASAQRQAEQRAVNQIKRALTFIVGELVDAQVQSGRVSSSVSGELKQTASAALDKAALGGVQKVESGADATFVAWAVYSLSKDEALKEVTKAVNAAKEKVSAGNFNLNDFDAKFTAAATREWK